MKLSKQALERIYGNVAKDLKSELGNSYSNFEGMIKDVKSHLGLNLVEIVEGAPAKILYIVDELRYGKPTLDETGLEIKSIRENLREAGREIVENRIADEYRDEDIDVLCIKGGSIHKDKFNNRPLEDIVKDLNLIANKDLFKAIADTAIIIPENRVNSKEYLETLIRRNKKYNMFRCNKLTENGVKTQLSVEEMRLDRTVGLSMVFKDTELLNSSYQEIVDKYYAELPSKTNNRRTIKDVLEYADYKDVVEKEVVTPMSVFPELVKSTYSKKAISELLENKAIINAVKELSPESLLEKMSTTDMTAENIDHAMDMVLPILPKLLSSNIVTQLLAFKDQQTPVTKEQLKSLLTQENLTQVVSFIKDEIIAEEQQLKSPLVGLN